MHRQHIAYGKNDGRTAEQLLVGEAELHAEKHRKIDSHAREGGIKQKEHVLDHEVGGATNAIQCAKVDATAELEAKAVSTYSHGCIRRGTHPFIIGMESPCRVEGHRRSS